MTPQLEFVIAGWGEWVWDSVAQNAKYFYFYCIFSLMLVPIFTIFKTAVEWLFAQWKQTKHWIPKFGLQKRKLIFKHLYCPYFQVAFVVLEAHSKFHLLLVLIMRIPIVIITIIVLIHRLCASISCGSCKTNIRWFQAASSNWGSVELHWFTSAEDSARSPYWKWQKAFCWAVSLLER